MGDYKEDVAKTLEFGNNESIKSLLSDAFDEAKDNNEIKERHLQHVADCAEEFARIFVNYDFSAEPTEPRWKKPTVYFTDMSGTPLSAMTPEQIVRKPRIMVNVQIDAPIGKSDLIQQCLKGSVFTPIDVVVDTAFHEILDKVVDNCFLKGWTQKDSNWPLFLRKVIPNPQYAGDEDTK